jgi:sugar lactone lactonase YvrE
MKATSWFALVLCAGCATAGSADAGRGDILINGTGVHPESVTSSGDGSLFTGSVPGIIYRAGPNDTTAEPFITPDAQNGLRSTYGVLADDAQGRLWVCSVAPFGAPRGAPQQPSEVVAFELKTGKLLGRWPFPGGGTCNDIAIGADGAAHATDTPGGRILKLPKGGSALEVVAADDRLRGIDGIAFGADGRMYINNVQKQEMWRVELRSGGAPAVLTKLDVDITLAGPDGLRPIDGNRFLQAEGTAGRITLLTIDGNAVKTVVLREGLQSSPGVTLVGNTAYAVEGKINYLFDPQLRGQDPGPFKAIAIPLPR